MSAVPIEWGAIPDSLAVRPQWLLWRFEPNPKKPEGKKLKVPYWAIGSRRSGTQGEARDRARLVTLAQAQRVFESSAHYEGIGFAFLPGDGLIGIDIDGAIDEDGVIRERDQKIIDACASYTEFSPSGRGVHIIVEGTTTSNKFDPIGLEVFCGSQFFTFTAKRWHGTPTTVNKITDETLARLHAVINTAKERAAEANAKAAPSAPPAAAQRQGSMRSGAVDDFKRVNQTAMQALDQWVPSLFPNARKRGGKYRITSKDLGRENEEDLSIDPRGIKDFGVHDMGDIRDGARTPIDLVIEWGGVKDAKEALHWLAQRLSIELSPPPRRTPAGRAPTRLRRPSLRRLTIPAEEAAATMKTTAPGRA